VRPQDAPCVKRLIDIRILEALQTQAKRPLCACEVLSLDRIQPLYNVMRTSQCRAHEMLTDQPLLCEIQLAERFSVLRLCHYRQSPPL